MTKINGFKACGILCLLAAAGIALLGHNDWGWFLLVAFLFLLP